MSLANREPLSIAQVLDQGFGLFRRSVVRLLPLSFFAALIGAAPSLLQTYQRHIGAQRFNFTFGVMTLVGAIVSMMILVAVLRLLDDIHQQKNQMTLESSLAGSPRYLLPLLGGGICYALVIMVGMILLVIPGIYLMLALGFFTFFIVLDNAGAIDSLKLSRELVRGHWWRTGTIMTIALLIFMAVYFAAGALLALMIPFAKRLPESTDAGEVTALVLLVQGALMVVMNSLLYPLIYAISLVTYRDLQLRKSGADLAARIEQAA